MLGASLAKCGAAVGLSNAGCGAMLAVSSARTSSAFAVFDIRAGVVKAGRGVEKSISLVALANAAAGVSIVCSKTIDIVAWLAGA